ncbi:MAG: 3-phosphoshikimate 1-carboxyvinyltransferase [Thermoplasmata archaeon]|nr:3-phosphoshikimate 1-carboxyvinyltransferase [Thermoplasmata archaeon]
MTKMKIRPSRLDGRLDAPPSKSYTHRALIAGFLAGRRYRVRRPLHAADTVATRRGLVALGARVITRREEWALAPPPAGTRMRSPARIRCDESGTTLRFLTAVAARVNTPVVFDGAGGLAVRPMQGLVDALRHSSVRVDLPARGSLPLTVTGPIRSGQVVVDGSVSSQYISALLLVLPTLDGASSLRVRGTAVSVPYIEATLAVLRYHGITVRGPMGDWAIPGNQAYHASRFDVPGDASSAAYLWAGAAVSGGRAEVRGVPAQWPQADRRILDVLRRSGARVHETAGGVTVEGPLVAGIDADLTGSPDLYPLLGALAACIPATSNLRGGAHVVFKESNRRRATIELVRALGATARPTADGLRIRGVASPRRLKGLGSDDHRMVMSAAVAALVADGTSTLDNASAVAKSFPDFWAAFAKLGAGVGVAR